MSGCKVLTVGILLTREQLAEWVGRPLSFEEMEQLAACVPHSSIPDAVGTVATEALGIVADD